MRHSRPSRRLASVVECGGTGCHTLHVQLWWSRGRNRTRHALQLPHSSSVAASGDGPWQQARSRLRCPTSTDSTDALSRPLLSSFCFRPHLHSLPIALYTYTMASRAIPSHLKPAAAEGGEGFSSQRHHGKTQSHVVSGLSNPAIVLSMVYPELQLCSHSCTFEFGPFSLLTAPPSASGSYCNAIRLAMAGQAQWLNGIMAAIGTSTASADLLTHSPGI